MKKGKITIYVKYEKPSIVKDMMDLCVEVLREQPLLKNEFIVTNKYCKVEKEN